MYVCTLSSWRDSYFDLFISNVVRLEADAEIFQNTHEDREQGDFVDYEWANIGSFDDFDRIFR